MIVDLHKSLSIILDDTSNNHQYDNVSELVQKLQNARQQVFDIEHKIATIKHKMNSDLALNVRRTQPGLNVAVDKNGCKVGYKTKLLYFTPDIENEIWKVTSPYRRFLREFLNSYRRATLINNDLSMLVTAIVSYFISYYRTLNEEINGTGLLMIENKRGTLLELIQWRSSIKKPLKSRLGRLT